ncbi:MAG: hypothetical protein ABFD80_04050 [Acidobacteriota bacterium]
MPRLAESYALNFYGGEPLLNLGLIRSAVLLTERLGRETGKKPRFSLTTNGSLITEESARFFARHGFGLEISCDGLAQGETRRKGSLPRVTANIRRLLGLPGASLEVNSVFTPGTVGRLSESACLFLEMGVPSVRISLDGSRPWPKASLSRLEREMGALRKVVLALYRRSGRIGVADFRPGRRKGLFYCAAGKDRFAVAPDGAVWGCHMFPGHFRGKEETPEYRRYFFGGLDELAGNGGRTIPKIRANHAGLSAENFTTSRGPCLFCPDVETCAVCPVAAALSGGALGAIPRHICEIQRIRGKERRKFAEEAAALG